MPTNKPGLQYPSPGDNQEIVNKNLVDNLQFIRSILPNVAAHTITIPKLTTNGQNGSITFNQYGMVTAFSDPT